jgi:small subunit ribosomal protein S1
MTNFGAFVEIEPGIDGMIHISDLSWTRKYGHPSESLQKGQEIKCLVLEVNEEKQRVSLGIKQMTEDPWIHAIPEKYIPGHIIKGKIAKLTNFGAFVELEPELEGLLHISELADHKIDKPQDIVKPGDEVEVKILKVDPDARKIGLSLRRVQWAAEEKKDAAAVKGKGKTRSKDKEKEVVEDGVALATETQVIEAQGTDVLPQEPAQSVPKAEDIEKPDGGGVEPRQAPDTPSSSSDSNEQEKAPQS